MEGFGSQELELTAETFYAAYGRVFAEWSGLELALVQWYSFAVGDADSFQRTKSHTEFFNLLGFDRKIKALRKAFRSVGRDSVLTEYFEAMLTKARAYSRFRNRLAHDAIILNWPMKRMNIQRHQDLFGRGELVLLSDLEMAIKNFNRLSMLIVMSRPPVPDCSEEMNNRFLGPRQALVRLQAIPNEPDKKS